MGIWPSRFPARAAPAQLRGRELDADFAPDCIDGDAVTTAQQPDRAAEGGFRRDMPHDEPVTPPGEASIGDQGDLIAEPTPGDRAGRAQHLPHARATAWPLAADHDDISRPYGPAKDRGSCPLLTLED